MHRNEELPKMGERIQSNWHMQLRLVCELLALNPKSKQLGA